MAKHGLLIMKIEDACLDSLLLGDDLKTRANSYVLGLLTNDTDSDCSKITFVESRNNEYMVY